MRVSRMLFSLTGLLLFVGCQTLRPQTVPVSNPIHIRSNNFDLVWEKTIDTLHEYQFAIAGENRLSGEIETDYKTGASLFEPWHFDAANVKERAQGTIQSIRRKVLVHLTQVDDGYLVSMEAFKELEDFSGTASGGAGDSTLGDSPPLKRSETGLHVGTTESQAPSGWIFQGRDSALEQSLLDSLRRNLQGF